MKKLAAAAVLALLAAGSGVTIAKADPGPGNGNNTFGLCTAYFAGSDTGREHKRNAPPFQALEEEAGVEDDDTQEERDEAVREYCDEFGQQPGNRP